MFAQRRQLLAAIESVEGVAETLGAANGKTIVENLKYTPNVEIQERPVAKASFSKVKGLVGKKTGSVTFDVTLRGSGDINTSADWTKFILASGFVEIDVLQVGIGAVASGPFENGETVVGGTSSAEGRVVINTADGDANILLEVLSGTFEDAETITGAVSGATATLSGTASFYCKGYKLISENVPSMTLASLEDGLKKSIVGGRGKVKFSGKAGETFKASFEFFGAYGGVSDVSMITDINFGNPPVEPQFQNANFTFGGEALIVDTVSVDVANVNAPRPDANSSGGIKGYIIGDRTISFDIDPEMTSCADFDFHGKFEGASEEPLDFCLGTASGNMFRFYAPRAQIKSLGDEERETIKVAGISGSLNGSEGLEDNELIILAL